MTTNTSAAGGRIWTPDVGEANTVSPTVSKAINTLRIASSLLGMAAVLVVILKSVT